MPLLAFLNGYGISIRNRQRVFKNQNTKNLKIGGVV